MADENQDEEQKRLQLEEFQRRQAEAALEASRNKPNAIPATREQPIRGVDYSQAAGTNGQVLGTSGGGTPTIEAMNRPRSEWGTPAQSGEPDRLFAPNTIINTSQGTPASGVGDYIDRYGNELGPTHNEQGVPNPPPTGVVGVQGRLSPQEQQFWAANPMGAVPHPQTGELVGLGSNIASRQAAFESITDPRDLAAQRTPPPNFINIPEVDPAIQDRRNQIQSALDENANRLRTASTHSGRGQISDYAKYSAERNQLLHADSALALEQHRQTQDRSTATLHNLTLQHQYSTSQDATAAGIALGRINAPLGSNERTQALAKITNDYPDAVRDPRFHQAWLESVKHNADHAAYMQYAQQNGLVPQMTHTGPTGVSYNYKPVGQQEIADSEKELKPYHISLEQIRNPAQAKIVDENGNQNSSGNFVQLMGTGGSEKPSQIPLSLYQKYGGQLSKEDQAAQTQPQGTPQHTAQPAAKPQPEIPKITSDEDYRKLQSKSFFVDPNGVRRQKP